MPLRKLKQYAALPLYEQCGLLTVLWYRAKGVLFYRRVFGSFGSKSTLFRPMLIRNAKHIHIGSNVSIRPGVRLEAVVLDDRRISEIRIGNNVNIEQNVHIVAQGSIVIGDNVSITANCSILCGTHPFWDVHDPVKIGERPGDFNSRTEIGAGSMLGVGAIIQNGVKLGRSVVVGSGAVVKKSMPDFCVIDGNPAVAVMRFDVAEDRWVAAAKGTKQKRADDTA